MIKARKTLWILAAVVLASAALARPLGYPVPLAGGPIFKDDQALFAFAARHEILKFVPPEMAVAGAPPNVVPRDPSALKPLSRLESVRHDALGDFQIVYLPMWCGHKDATDHIAYVLKVTPAGRQLVGRVEYERACTISRDRPYRIACDSYLGAKGSTVQAWKGKSFQWEPLVRR